MRLTLTLAASLLVSCLPSPAAALLPPTHEGRVFEDLDGDGMLDAGEPVLPGVAVSDGRRIVRTDAQGRYAFPLEPDHTVFVIKPAGYTFPRRADGMPDFWNHVQFQPGPPLKFGGIPRQSPGVRDFALRRETRTPGPLDVLVFGDPQPKSATDVGYYERDIIEPIQRAAGDRPAAQLGLTLGDVVNDDLSLYPAMNRATARLGLPWLHAAGNHDLDFDAGSDEDSLRSFRNTYGPDSFAWEEGHASFIVLDDVVYRPGQSPAYIGGLREQQFEFLAAYLAGLPRDRRLVIAAHIPVFDEPGRETFRRADRLRLFELLRPFGKVLLLTAHGHVQRHYRHGPADGWHGAEPLHEYNVGAACGGYWGGPKDADGLPDARMADGTPNGYARLQISETGAYSLRWMVARGGDQALSLHAPEVLRRGAWPGVGLYANVFMGEADSRVEMRIDGGDWQPMRRVDAPDPALRAENLRDDAANTLRGYDRLPEAADSTHLWRGNLPTDLAPGGHRVEVRAFDRWRGELSASRVYRLEEAAE